MLSVTVLFKDTNEWEKYMCFFILYKSTRSGLIKPKVGVIQYLS